MKSGKRGEIKVVEVKLKEGESYENLLRRFTRKVQQSGVLIRARKLRFFEAPKSKMLQRHSALRRAELREKREELKKLGKITYQSFSGSRGGYRR